MDHKRAKLELTGDSGLDDKGIEEKVTGLVKDGQ